MQNLVASSKLLAQKPPSDRSTLDKMNLEATFSAQIELRKLLRTFKSQIQAEINTDLFLLFNEKKYKEIYAFYQRAERNQLNNLIAALQPFQQVHAALLAASQTRKALLAGQEVPQGIEAGNVDFATFFSVLKGRQLETAYLEEAEVLFNKNYEAEKAMKEEEGK